MFGFRKRDRIRTVEDFFKSQNATVKRADDRAAPRMIARVLPFLVPVVALLIIAALAAHAWRLRSEVGELRDDNSQKASEIAALTRRGEALTAELDKSWKQIDQLKADVARLEKEQETQNFLRQKEAQAEAARKAAAARKKAPRKKAASG
ncbi:MAG: hypothetical protein ABSC19_13050 [Syntrophorhabdales bacterium]|jgi:cell division protein FtsB